MHRNPATALVGCILLAGLTATHAGTVQIDFDDVGAPGAFKQIFPGFDNGPTLEYPEITLEGCVILNHFVFGLAATSGINICATCDTCTLGDDNPGPPTELPGMVTGTFTDLASSIDLDVINGFGGSAGTFTLTAFDSQGGVAGTASVLAAPFESPGFVQHLSLDATGIKSFTLTTNLPTGYTFAMDTLVTDVAPPPPEAGSVDGLSIDRVGAGQLRLRWGASCLATDGDYAVYEGTVGDFSTHVPVTCTTGGLRTETLMPLAGNTYYLVVPFNATNEGSAGTTNDGTERSPGAAPCLPRLVGTCE